MNSMTKFWCYLFLAVTAFLVIYHYATGGVSK